MHEENARGKALNDMIRKIVGTVLEDMTKSSRDKVEKYRLPLTEIEEADDTISVRKAREIGD